MNFNERPIGNFVDRLTKEPELESIDVIMLTLDARHFLERSLYTIYREIPVRKLLVCDGGSKDGTIEILKKFPRVELFVKPDFRTTGKSVEFLISEVETEWFVFIDADIELTSGWYNEMTNHKNEYDVVESGRRILSYHKYIEDETKLTSARSFDDCHLIRKKALENFHCEDDYLWRFVDIFIQQIVENSGFRYGKINSTLHIHNETEKTQYESDEEKNYRKLVIEQKHLILDEKKDKEQQVKNAKGLVKYIDPNNPWIKNRDLNNIIKHLDRKWIEKNNPNWLDRYNVEVTKKSSIKNSLRSFLKKFKKN